MEQIGLLYNYMAITYTLDESGNLVVSDTIVTTTGELPAVYVARLQGNKDNYNHLIDIIDEDIAKINLL